MPPKEGEYVVKLLISRNGLPSLVTLNSGATHRVLNITYGRDLGEEFDHLDANVSPSEEGWPQEFFLASEVREITDEDGTVLFRVTG
jgi:hypothetical protein